MLPRFLLAGLAALPLALIAADALALQEPNGLTIPTVSVGEVQLSAFFLANNETIDPVFDAYTTPSTFSPLCDFKATFVLNEAGSHFGLAWYNATGVKPAANELHVIVPANSAVGTVITSADIKNDPNYVGGLIGFALVGGETHYTEVAYDNVCTACNPPAPWITALVYPSTKISNAYYIAFEDGPTSASGWNNDGDFNDDVFLVEGVTCSGGGSACDTGLLGACGPGINQCTPNGIQCVGVTGSTGETCNGLDDDCNGATDEGNLCTPGKVCDHGQCVAQCGTEFVCDPGKACSDDGFCVEPACQHANCDVGTVCIGGTCKAPCDDVICPFGEDCRNGACVDPCLGVACDAATQVCESGVCVAKCTCLPCAAGATCDVASGHCGETACVGNTCAPTEHCVAGACIDDCLGATCPAGQICSMGGCIVDPNMTGSGGAGSTGALNPMTSSGDAGSTVTSGTDASSSSGAGAQGGAGGQGNGSSSSGCNCTIVDTNPEEATWPWALALGALGAGRVAGRTRRRPRA